MMIDIFKCYNGKKYSVVWISEGIYSTGDNKYMEVTTRGILCLLRRR